MAVSEIDLGLAVMTVASVMPHTKIIWLVLVMRLVVGFVMGLVDRLVIGVGRFVDRLVVGGVRLVIGVMGFVDWFV
jgi:hypothetical protein